VNQERGIGHGVSSESSLLILLVVFVGAMYAWHHYQPDVRHYQAAFLYWQARALAGVAEVPLVGPAVAALTGNTPETLREMARYLSLDGRHMDPALLSEITRTVGRYVSFLGLPVMALFAWLWHAREQRYSLRVRDTRHMHRLIERRYPDLSGMDLTGKPVFEGPWRVPDSVHFFAERNRLLNEDGSLNENRARKVFAAQLGRKFTGYKDLYAQPYGWAAKRILESMPRKYRRKALEDAAKWHRYDATVLVRLLEVSRRFGIVGSAMFRRMRGIDRAIWMALSSAGRRVVFAEGLGIMAQYHYEMEVRHLYLHARKSGADASELDKIRPRSAPFMDQAVREYAQALREVPADRPWVPDEELIENYDWTR